MQKRFKLKVKKIVHLHNKKLDVVIRRYLVESKDDITLILKSHLCVEQFLNRLLEVYLAKPKEIIKMSFNHKINLLEAFGFDNDDADFRIALIGINKLRNKVAHNLKFNLHSKEALDIVNEIYKLTGDKKAKSTRANLVNGVECTLSYLRTMWSVHKLFPIMSFAMLGKNSFSDDHWLKSKKLDELLEKEIQGFIEDSELVGLLTSAD